MLVLKNIHERFIHGDVKFYSKIAIIAIKQIFICPNIPLFFKNQKNAARMFQKNHKEFFFKQTAVFWQFYQTLDPLLVDYLA